MSPFDEILASVLARKQISLAELEAQLPQPSTASELAAQSDAFYLSQISLRVFRAGMTHRVVDSKWPNFEARFFGFEPADVAMISAEQIEACTQDAQLIRHLGKLRTLPVNAQAMLDIVQDFGSFGEYLNHWPDERVMALWQDLVRRFTRLGGNSGAYFLRAVGKDTPVLTTDVVLALQLQQVIDHKPSSKKALASIQEAFNLWQQQSQRPLCQISRILALSTGENPSWSESKGRY